MDISYKLKPETKDRLTSIVLEYQVIQTLLKERQSTLTALTGEALKELGASPDQYYLEMNPSQNIWLLKMIPEKAGAAAINDGGNGKDGHVETTVEEVKA